MDYINKIDRKYLILFAVLLIIIAFILHVRKKTNYAELAIVTDQSNFFTVASCVSKFVSYANNGDTDSLVKILNSSYKKKNNINTDNVLSYVGNIPANSAFSARKMYVEQVGKNTYKYYVYGELIDDGINASLDSKVDYYVIVYMNESNMTFSIEEYDGEIFKK